MNYKFIFQSKAAYYDHFVALVELEKNPTNVGSDLGLGQFDPISQLEIFSDLCHFTCN